MSLKFYEAVKTILADIETFLSVSLKSVSLPKAVVGEKDGILEKLNSLRQEYPQLAVEKKEKAPESDDEPQEIYEPIGDDAAPAQSIRPAESFSDIADVQSSISANDLSSSAAMSGNLVRKSVGSNLKNIFAAVFGKKYCVVSGGVFFLYDKVSSKKASGSFPLKGYEARVVADPSSKKEFCFELVNPGNKTYLFQAANQEEVDKWVSVLNKEALHNPDSRLSAFCDTQSVDEDLEYEDPTAIPKTSTSFEEEVYDDVMAATAPVPPKIDLKSNAKTNAKANVKSNAKTDVKSNAKTDVKSKGKTDVKSNAKTDAKANAKTNNKVEDFDDGEIYDEAESKVAEDEGDELYEAYDDVQALTKTATPSISSKTETPLSSSSDEIDYEKMFYGKWDCKADDDNELAFKRGDIIEIVSQEYDKSGWWVGCLQGTVGLVPREYLTPAYELVR